MDPSPNHPHGQGNPTATLAPPPAGPARSSSQEIGAAAKEQARETGRDLKHGAEEALHSVEEAGSHLLDEQKSRLAARLDEYKDALAAACDRLREDEHNPLAGPADRATRRLDQATRYLREKSGSDFLEDLGQLARRKPEWVFGGLFVAGLATARFLKASPRQPRSPGRREGPADSSSYGASPAYQSSPAPLQPAEISSPPHQL